MINTARCPRCGRDCAELFDPFGRHHKPPLFACDNCERGDSPDGSRALGPLTFNAVEAAGATVRVPRAALAALFAGFDTGVWVRGRNPSAGEDETDRILDAADDLFRALHGDAQQEVVSSPPSAAHVAPHTGMAAGGGDSREQHAPPPALELAEALGIEWCLAHVREVHALSGLRGGEVGQPFWAGHETACEEIAHRIEARHALVADRVVPAPRELDSVDREIAAQDAADTLDDLTGQGRR